GKVHQSIHFSPSKVHARGIIAITSSLIEYLLAKLLSFQGFIVIFGVGSLSKIFKISCMEESISTNGKGNYEICT
ncbi:hypothetical protein LOB44_08445, partial [Lactobacillus delbrueckii subsp. lactis]|nr:hypothetical protein [Lactobacillus delbrueckii subsp. lactis]